MYSNMYPAGYYYMYMQYRTKYVRNLHRPAPQRSFLPVIQRPSISHSGAWDRVLLAVEPIDKWLVVIIAILVEVLPVRAELINQLLYARSLSPAKNNSNKNQLNVTSDSSAAQEKGWKRRYERTDRNRIICDARSSPIDRCLADEIRDISRSSRLHEPLDHIMVTAVCTMMQGSVSEFVLQKDIQIGLELGLRLWLWLWLWLVFSFKNTSAPVSSSFRMLDSRPAIAALWRGVSLFVVKTLISTPLLWRRAFIHISEPLLAAMWRGVWLSCIRFEG